MIIDCAINYENWFLEKERKRKNLGINLKALKLDERAPRLDVFPLVPVSG